MSDTPIRSTGWSLRLRDPLNLPPLLFLLLWGGVALFTRPIGDFGVETDFYGDSIYSKRMMFGVMSPEPGSIPWSWPAGATRPWSGTTSRRRSASIEGS